MSWGIAPFVSKTKGGAIKKVEAQYEQNKSYFPKEAKDAIVAQVECFTVPEGKGLLVLEASGHVDSNYGNASIKMVLVDLVD